jgi:hypothetical protein
LLKAELQRLANLLTNTTAKYKCLILIDQYVAALTKQADVSASDVTSYSIDNRSVSRSPQKDYSSTVKDLERQINNILYDSKTLGDLSGNRFGIQW